MTLPFGMQTTPMAMLFGTSNFLEQFIQIVDAGDYFCRKMDQYEQDKRYDDNQKHMLVQALRMFEKGDLTKEQMKTIIDLLPDTVVAPTKPVEAVPQTVDVSSIDLDAILKKLKG